MSGETDEGLSALERADEFMEIENPPLELLIIARRGKGLRATKVNVQGAATAYFLKAIADTMADLDELEEVAYEADMDLAPEEVLVFTEASDVAEADLTQLLFSDTPHDLTDARDPKWHRAVAYAVIIGEDPPPDEDGTRVVRRVAFVRKTNPGRSARPGRLLTTVGQAGALVAVDEPVLTFDGTFDLIVGIDEVVGLSQRVFEDFYRYSAALLDRIPEWVGEVSTALPLADGGAEVLADKCRTDTRLRRRLRSIVDRGHLADVSNEQLASHVEKLGLERADFINDEGDLIVDQQDPYRLMYLLNEDLFLGGLTNARFRSDRKSTS